MKHFKIYITLFLLMLTSSRLWSQDISVSASLDTNMILIGAQTNIRLQMIQPKAKTVYLPMITDKIGDKVDMLSFSEPDTTVLSDGRLQISMSILITSFDTGYFAIPPFEYKYNVLNDSVYSSVNTNALLLGVFPLKVDMKKGITDIKPIIEEPFSIKEIIPYIIIALIVIVLLIVGIYVYKRIKNHKPIISLPKKPKIPPHIIAKKNLDLLSDKKLWQNGFVKEFYSELTEIIRSYMEDRFKFGAMEMITEDIIANLSKLELEKELVNETSKVLELSDFVKFAKVQPLADQNSQALKWAYNFVEKTKPIEKLNDKKEEVEP